MHRALVFRGAGTYSMGRLGGRTATHSVAGLPQAERVGVEKTPAEQHFGCARLRAGGRLWHACSPASGSAPSPLMCVRGCPARLWGRGGHVLCN